MFVPKKLWRKIEMSEIEYLNFSDLKEHVGNPVYDHQENCWLLLAGWSANDGRRTVHLVNSAGQKYEQEYVANRFTQYK